MSHKNLSEIDGLVHPELVGVEVVEESGGDISRGDVILRGALAAGAVYGTFMVGPFVRSAFAMGGGTSDVDILNFALTLEYLESTFYEEAKMKVKASGELKSLLSLLASDEKQHVEALEGTIKKLGGKPVAKPTFNFEYSGTSGFLKLAETFENVGVGAYNGAAPGIKSKEVLAAAGSIVQVEARHAAAIALQNGKEPAPEAVRQSARRKGSPEGRRTLHRLTPKRLAANLGRPRSGRSRLASDVRGCGGAAGFWLLEDQNPAAKTWLNTFCPRGTKNVQPAREWTVFVQ
jgi:hypothetical protein